jgi:hypothetical protein
MPNNRAEFGHFLAWRNICKRNGRLGDGNIPDSSFQLE